MGQLWQENAQNGTYEQLYIDIGGQKPSCYDTMFVNEMCRIHGMNNYQKINDTTFKFMECGFVTPTSKTDGYPVIEIPACTWAVFPSRPMTWGEVGSILSDLYKRFYSEWLPASEYEKADSPEFEMYGGKAGDGPEDAYIELWMPIVKKDNQ